LTNTSSRPAVAAARIAGEIAGYSSAGTAAGDGFLRLSAGGGTSGNKSYIDVTGYSTVTDMNSTITLGTAGTEKVRIDLNGNVGIGTTSPGYKLHVKHSTDKNLVVESMTAGMKVVSISDAVAEQPITVQGQTTSLMTSGTDRLFVTNSGNVGIGTTSPGAKLAIGGTPGTDGIMFPDGTVQTTKAGTNYQAFTASGTWTKPTWASGNELVVVQLWGAGGGGSNTAGGPGGGGGAYNLGFFRAASLSATESVVVGTSSAATAGGSSSFKSLIAYGGGGSTATYSCGGGGGGQWAAGSTPGSNCSSAAAAGGGPIGGTWAGTGDSLYGGGAGSVYNVTCGVGRSIYGGGGGSGCLGTYGGASTYGGGGGAPSAGQGGTSVLGGAGGSPGTSPTAPGGGGGPQQAGARGEVRVWVIP
jgi:hypothetical protein